MQKWRKRIFSNRQLGMKVYIYVLYIQSLHQDSNDNAVRIANFATSKSLIVNSMMFPHRNIHKYTWTSPNGRTQPD